MARAIISANALIEPNSVISGVSRQWDNFGTFHPQLAQASKATCSFCQWDDLNDVSSDG
jgi:hypothetical protein